MLHAEICYGRGEIAEARDLAIQAAQMNGYNSLVLNILGKVYIKLGEHDKALQYLEKADSLSPNNMERLCNIANEHAAAGNNNDSKKVLDQLRSDAPDAIMVKEASLVTAVKSGLHEEASIALGSMDSSSSLVTFWNSQGISYVTGKD